MATDKLAHVIDEFRGSFTWLLPVSIATTALIRHFSFPASKNSCAHGKTSRREAEAKYGHRIVESRPSDTPGGGFEVRSGKIGEAPSACVSDEIEKLGIYDEWDAATGVGFAGTAVLYRTLPSPPQKSLGLKSSPLASSMLFMNLPPEIRISILSHCAPNPSARLGPHSMDTFLTLLRVSKTIQREAYIACLPFIPLALWSKKGVRSFRAFLQKNKDLGPLVRYLWIGTGKLDEEELQWALDVVGCVPQLKSIACGEYFLAECLNKGVLTSTCERVTLMSVERDAEYQARGVRQVRLCTGVYSTSNRFPDVETLCFNAKRMNVKDERVKMEYEALDKWIECVQKFVLVERDPKRISARGLGVKFKVIGRTERPDMFSVTLPARWTEWDIWSAEVVGLGVWDVCGL